MLKKLEENCDRSYNHRFQRSRGGKRKIKVYLGIVSVYRKSLQLNLKEKTKQINFLGKTERLLNNKGR